MNQLPPQNEVTGRNFTRLDQHHSLKYRLRNPAYIFSPVENIRGQPSPPTGCARSPVSSPEIPSLFFFFFLLALVALARAPRDEGRHSCRMHGSSGCRPPSLHPLSSSPASEERTTLARARERENFSGLKRKGIG